MGCLQTWGNGQDPTRRHTLNRQPSRLPLKEHKVQQNRNEKRHGAVHPEQHPLRHDEPVSRCCSAVGLSAEENNDEGEEECWEEERFRCVEERETQGTWIEDETGGYRDAEGEEDDEIVDIDDLADRC